MQIFSFPPIVGPAPSILILGTMPGIPSLKVQQYYGFKGNHFWKLMFELLETPFSENYEDRVMLLKDHHIALWDVLKACVRESSRDSAIQKEEPNDLKTFLSEHPSLKAIFFNGKMAARFFKHRIGTVPLLQFTLPSSSSANTRFRYKDKKNAWGEISKYL